ncbi:MAG: hypothetical protein WC453_04785 [Patescibacteria group bacterium]
MSILKKISEEVVPLSSRQTAVLLVIIACIFEFVLFFAPALADEAVQQAKAQAPEEEILINDSVTKEPGMNQEAAKLAAPVKSDADQEMAGSGPETATSSPTAPATEQSGQNSQYRLPTADDRVIDSGIHVITAYNSEAAQTDDSPCITANGFNVCAHGAEDTIAANFLKFGTKVKIPELFGNRIFIVRDRMNVKHPTRVDIWMKNKHDALQFGVKVAQIQVIE